MSPQQTHDPMTFLGKSLGKSILIKCKRQKTFKGILRSYDSHLNVLLDDVEYQYHVRSEENHEELIEKNEKFSKIVLRGDSIVFIGL
ncbi:MAG: LSM domain-containing protein [Promethearchaeota archaeon]